MEIRKIALSLIAVMALSATTVQAQTTNTCKKTPTAKAKICFVLLERRWKETLGATKRK